MPMCCGMAGSLLVDRRQYAAGYCGRTRAPTSLRTKGRSTSRIGKATTQEVAQALIHAETTPGARPTLFAVETPETMQDIRIERIKGVTKLA